MSQAGRTTPWSRTIPQSPPVIVWAVERKIIGYADLSQLRHSPSLIYMPLLVDLSAEETQTTLERRRKLASRRDGEWVKPLDGQILLLKVRDLFDSEVFRPHCR